MVSTKGESLTVEAVHFELERERDALIDVATHQASIDDLNEEYRLRRRLLQRALSGLGVPDPNEWSDLWLWHGFIKRSGDSLSTYQSRREFIIERYDEAFREVDQVAESDQIRQTPAATTGWTTVDDRMKKMHERHDGASDSADFQDVGNRCRDVVIALGHAVYDPVRHAVDGEPMPKADDAKNRLKHVVRSAFAGSRYERLRSVVVNTIDGTWQLVTGLVHRVDAEPVEAAVAVLNTDNLVREFRALVPDIDEPDLTAIRADEIELPAASESRLEELDRRDQVIGIPDADIDFGRPFSS